MTRSLWRSKRAWQRCAVVGAWILVGGWGLLMGVAHAQERVETLEGKYRQVSRDFALAAKPESRLDSTKGFVDSVDFIRAVSHSSALESTNTPAHTSAKKLLLLFSSKSCKPCHTLESNLAQVAPALESGFSFHSLDIYEKSPILLPLSPAPVSIKALRQELGVIATPTLVAFDDDLSPIFTHQGVLSARELAYLLELLQALPLDLPTKESKSQWIKSRLLAFSRAMYAPTSSISTQGQP